MKRIWLFVVVSVLVLSTGTAFAQLSKADIDQLKVEGQQEGWTFEVGENEATQYSLEELCGMEEPPDWRVGATFDPMTSAALTALPSAFDWRDYGGTTPIRNQGGCGSCWAFATVGPLECNIKIRDGVSVNLSEQWLVSCNQMGWDCGGGWWAHSYHMGTPDPCGDGGAVLESAFPYVAYNAACHCPYPHSYWLQGWAYIGSDRGVADVEQIKHAIVQYGPVAVSIYVNRAFQSYRGGIFNGCEAGTINHAVTLVGWDDNQGTGGVWIVRNSWGTSWGESGYMRIPYNCSQVGYAACYVRYRPIDLTASVEMGQAPLPVDFAMAVDWADVISCRWDFGDGTTSTDPAPHHEYTNPGTYDVKLTVTTPEGEFQQISPDFIAALADTLAASDVLLGDGSGSVEVRINVSNYVTLKELRVPFSWEGDLNLKFDSFSVAGTRISHFNNVTALNYDPAHFRADLMLDAGTAAPLTPGSGRVLSVWFTAPGGYSGSTPIEFISYGSHTPKFYALGSEYTPVLDDGSVYTGVATSCCVGRVGDANQSGDDEPTISDINAIIDFLYIDGNPLPCLAEADANVSGGTNPTAEDITIGDISVLIDYLYILNTPLHDCP